MRSGWALTLISKENISYASTAQTIGLNCGYFLSFTVFLALNSIEFATKYGIPQLSLERYLQFWGIVCYAVTLWLLFFKTEASQSRLGTQIVSSSPTLQEVDPSEDSELNLKMVYTIMWRICKLKRSFLASFTPHRHDTDIPRQTCNLFASCIWFARLRSRQTMPLPISKWWKRASEKRSLPLQF